MKVRILLVGLFFIFGLFTTLSAQTTKKKVVKIQIKQQKRIHHGLKQGTLNKREAQKLQRQQRNIQHTKKAAAADGKVTRRERKIIAKKQQKASKTIYRKKHN